MTKLHEVTAAEAKRVEAWVWVLVYAGLIGIGLGLSVRRGGNPAFGGWIVMAGSGLVAAGIGLIGWRSRMQVGAPQAPGLAIDAAIESPFDPTERR